MSDATWGLFIPTKSRARCCSTSILNEVPVSVGWWWPFHLLANPKLLKLPVDSQAARDRNPSGEPLMFAPLLSIQLVSFTSWLCFSRFLHYLFHLEEMVLVSYRRVVGELAPFLELFCVGWRRVQAGQAAQQGSGQSILSALASGGNGGSSGGWREGSCLSVPCLLQLSVLSAWTTSTLILKGLASWIVSVDSILGGIRGCGGECHKGQLCNDQKLTQTHNEWEVCLGAPAPLLQPWIWTYSSCAYRQQPSNSEASLLELETIVC